MAFRKRFPFSALSEVEVPYATRTSRRRIKFCTRWLVCVRVFWKIKKYEVRESVLTNPVLNVEHHVQARLPKNQMLLQKIRNESAIRWSMDANFCKLVEPLVNWAGWPQFSCCSDPQLFCRKMSEEGEDKDEEDKGKENSEAQVEEKSVSQGAVMEA